MIVKQQQEFVAVINKFDSLFCQTTILPCWHKIWFYSSGQTAGPSTIDRDDTIHL
jgi:hypothetical protein